MSKKLTAPEAASALKISLTMLYIHIKSGRLKAEKNGKRWVITQDQIDDFIRNKYIHLKAGDLLLGGDKMSITQACYEGNLSYQSIYYHLRRGRVPHEVVEGRYVITRDTLNKLTKGKIHGVPVRTNQRTRRSPRKSSR